MKKFIIFLVIVLLAWLVVRQFNNGSTTKEIKVEETQTKPDMSNGAFIIEGNSVSLEAGQSSVPAAPGSALTVDTELGDQVAYGDLNADGKNDAAGFLIQSGGGTGVFVYVVGYISGNVQYKGTNGVFVGDRISPKSIDIKDGKINITYLDRKSGEPYAAEPTVLTNKTFIYKNGEIIEQ